MGELTEREIGNRYFVYERYKRGALLIGKGCINITCGEFDYWGVKCRGYKTKSAATKLLKKDPDSYKDCLEVKVVGYSLTEFVDDNGISQKYRVKQIYGA